MNIRLFHLLAAALLLLGFPLHGAPPKAPKLETLLEEYKQARAEVLGKLNEAYAAQADALAQQLQSAANLDAADRARGFARRLRDPNEKNDVYAAMAASAAPADLLAQLEANYGRSREENLRNVYLFYATSAASLRQELLRTKDQAGAAVVGEFLQKIKPSPSPQPSPAKPHTASAK